MRRALPAPLLAALSALVLAACGGSGDDAGGDAAPPPQPAPTARAEDFPEAQAGMGIEDLVSQYPQGPNLAPSVQALEPGTNRFGFALFDNAMKQLPEAAVALYVANADGSGLRGPFVARSESLETKPQYRSRQAAEAIDDVKSFYVADLPLEKGKAAVIGLARVDGRLVSTSPTGFEVGAKGAKPPNVGDPAIEVSTPTVADVGGDLSKIDTRIPPLRAMHEVDFADVLGKEPVVLAFVTPQLCQTRVCGPTLDVVEQVRAESGEGVRFVHQEIYNDNQISKGLRPQVRAWKLVSEPWIFVIDRAGQVAARFEGAVSVGELQRAVAAVKQ